MIMRLFAGTSNPQIRSRLVLGGVAVAALVLSLLLAYAAAMFPRWQESVRAQAAVQARIPLPTPQPLNPAPFVAPGQTALHRPQAPALWSLLTPGALIVDVMAALGLVAMVLMWRR